MLSFFSKFLILIATTFCHLFLLLKKDPMSLLTNLLTLALLSILIISAPTLIQVTKIQYADLLYPRHKVGLVTFTCPLEQSRRYTMALEKLFKDETIKGIVLYIDCADAAAGTAQAIYEEIEQLKKEYPKPIITLIENSCTGYAYWIACAADSIVAPGSAIVGIITASSEPDSTFSEEIRQDREKQYTTTVALRRKLSLKTPELWSKGLVTGQQAYKIHLIDHMGGMSLITKLIKEKALIDGEIDWIEDKKPLST
jgi:ClpP class serine protease